jgi:hypothetical protein
MKPCDELIGEAGRGRLALGWAHDDRDEHPLQLDRRGEPADVLCVERPHVVGDVDLLERDREPAGGGCGGGHQALL